MVTQKLDGKSITQFINPLPNLLTPGLYIDATGGGSYDITMSQGLHDFGLGLGTTNAWGYHSDSAPHGASESLNGGVRTQPHLHGGLTVASSDGNPFATDAFLGTETYNYNNAQSALTSWYHDHALGITRLNVFAGLAV